MYGAIIHAIGDRRRTMPANAMAPEDVLKIRASEPWQLGGLDEASRICPHFGFICEDEFRARAQAKRGLARISQARQLPGELEWLPCQR